MASKVAIFNLALTLLGQNPISDPDGDETSAISCRQVYDICRKSLLEQHPWNFALKRVSLAQDTGTPVMEYNYSYTLPTDCVRIVKIYSPSTVYKEEAGKILTDDGTMELVYIRDEQNTGTFPGMFTELLATDIALAMEYRVTQQLSMQGVLRQKRMELLIKAKMIDAQKDYNSKNLVNTGIDSMDYPYGDI